MKHLIQISIVAIIFAISFSAEVSAQTLLPIRISVGNEMEEWVAQEYNMPNAKLVNIFTSKYFGISKPTGELYDYEFITSGDSIGYATLWIATYYDHIKQDTISVTFCVPSVSGTLSVLTWNAVFLELLSNTIFSTTPIEVSVKEFGEFISKVDAIDTKMDEAIAGLYVFGAGVPEFVEIKGEKLDFNKDEAIFYSQFLLSDSIGNIDMCYQYFDSSDISCNYNSIRNEPTIANIKVSPNPTNATSTLTLDLEKAGNLKITLNDLHGDELLELHNKFEDTGTFATTFSLEKFPTGVYFLKINHNGNVKMEKVIRN